MMKDLEALPERQQKRLVRAMVTIQEILERDATINLIDCSRERQSR